MTVQLLDRELDRLEGLWSDGLADAYRDYLDAVQHFEPDLQAKLALAAALIELGIRLQGLGGRAAPPTTLLMGDLCLARGSRILADNAPLAVQVAFAAMLERIAPIGAGYEHDDFTRRFDIAVDEPVNGHAHCRQLLLSAFLTLLVEEGQLVLGRWQSIFAVELDGPRHRELALQLEGEFARPIAREIPESLVEVE